MRILLWLRESAASCAPTMATPCFTPRLHKPAASPAQGKGRALSCSALREPSASKRPMPSPRLVSLRHSGSPAVCLRGSGNLRLPKAYVFGHALFPFAAQGAGTLWLRLRACLPSLAAEPPASSPCDPRSPSVSAGILFVIPAKAGIRGLRFASLYHSRNAVSPSMFTIGERCHSDGVLPSVSKAKRRGISLRIGQ